MKRINVLFILPVFAIGLLFTSCGKEEGCTDEIAINFNTEAEEDDGSCVYEAGVLFWYDPSTANFLDVYGHSTLTYFFDGQEFGTQSSNVAYDYAPDCGQPGTISFTWELTGTKKGTFPYYVLNQNSDTVWSDNMTILTDSCNRLQLQI